MPVETRIVRKPLMAVDGIGALVRIPAGGTIRVLGTQDDKGFVEILFSAKTLRLHVRDIEDATDPAPGSST